MLSHEIFEHVNSMLDNKIILAARSGNLDMLKSYWNILRHEFGETTARKIFLSTNRLGKCCLHESAQNSMGYCLQFLLNEVCLHPDSIKQGDWTPLMLSCTKDDVVVIKLLLDAGADITLRNKDGWTAFHILCRGGNKDIVSVFLDCYPTAYQTVSKNGRSTLHTMALHGHLECIQIVAKLMLESNENVDVRDSCGCTPLMDSFRSNHLEISSYLLQIGASLCSTDNLGRNCLHIASEANQLESVKYLCEKEKFDKNLQTKHGFTALHFASKEGHSLVVQYLLNEGADCNKLDFNDRNAEMVSKNDECRYIFQKFRQMQQ